MSRYILCLVVAYLLGWVSHMSYVENTIVDMEQPEYREYEVPQERQYPPLPEGAVNDLRRAS